MRLKRYEFVACRRRSFGAPRWLAFAALTATLLPVYARATDATTDPAAAQEAQVSVQIIDAQAFQPNANGSINVDPATPPPAGYIRTGALTDGASVLVVQMFCSNVPAGTPVQVSIQHTNPGPFPQTTDYIGSLWSYTPAAPFSFPALPAPDSGGGATAITVPSSGPGIPSVFYFRPPNNYWFGASSKSQNLDLRAAIAGLNPVTTRLQLVRPTIVVAHGICSNQWGDAALGERD